jgi:hypothetical protein
MTDYIRAYNGEGLAFEQDSARQTAGWLRDRATITNGIIRWNSNQQVPPVECVALAVHIGLPVDIAACNRLRAAETTAFLTAYRKRRRPPSAEERFEIRANFGSRSSVVDVVTGQVIRT